MKKTLCFILVLVMVISMVPVASAADGADLSSYFLMAGEKQGEDNYCLFDPTYTIDSADASVSFDMYILVYDENSEVSEEVYNTLTVSDFTFEDNSSQMSFSEVKKDGYRFYTTVTITGVYDGPLFFSAGGQESNCRARVSLSGDSSGDTGSDGDTELASAPKLMYKQIDKEGNPGSLSDNWTTYTGLSTDALFFLVDGETETPVSFSELSCDGPVTLSYNEDTGIIRMEATGEGKAMVWLTDNADAEEFFVYVSSMPGGEGGDGGESVTPAEGLYYRDMARGFDQPLYEDKENYNLVKEWPGAAAGISRTVKFYFLDSDGNEHELSLSELSFTPNLSGALTRQTVDSSTTGEVIDFGAEAPGMGSVSYTLDGKTYALEVDVGLPSFGFYKAPSATVENYISEVLVSGEACSFYFIANEGCTISDASLSGNLNNAAEIEKHGDVANCYKITVSGEAESGICFVEYSGSTPWNSNINGWNTSISVRVVHPSFGFRYADDPGIVTTSWCAVPGDSAAVKFVWNDGSEDTELGLSDITLPDFLEASEEFGVVTLTAKSTGTGVISYGDADMVVSVRESIDEDIYAAVVDGYTVGFGLENEGGVIDIIDGQGGFNSGVGSERKDEYGCITDVFNTQFIAGIKKTDSNGNTYYEPAENVNIIPLEMWIENTDGNASGISLSDKGHEMLVSTFPDNSVNVYGRRGYEADARVCALLIVDTGNAEKVVQVSCPFSIYRVIWVREIRQMGDSVEAVNARLQEIAEEYVPGDTVAVEMILAPQEYEGTIVIPETFRGIDMMDFSVDFHGTISNGSQTVLNGAVDLNGTMLSSINGICFKATEDCKTAIYGGYLSNMNGCSFWDYDIAVDASEGGITLTKSNFFVNNDIAVRMDMAEAAVPGFNHNPFDSNVFLNNGIAFQIKSMPQWLSIYNFRVVNSNFINNETDFDIQTPGTFYMYKNYYGDIHNQSLDLSMEEILAGLAAVKTDTDVRGQQFISSNSPNIEIAKGTKAKVVTNPRWKYPTLEVWSGWHDINLGFDHTQPIATFAEIEYYTNVLISDWTQETQIVSEEADELLINAESFDEEGEKAIAVVDKDENALGSWTFED